MRTLEYTLPDGTTGTATPDDVAAAAQSLLMDGTMVMDATDFEEHVRRAREMEARHSAIVRALVARAVERGLVGQLP